MKQLTAVMLALLSSQLLANPPAKPEAEALSLDFLEFLAEFADENGEVHLPDEGDEDVDDEALKEADVPPIKGASGKTVGVANEKKVSP